VWRFRLAERERRTIKEQYHAAAGEKRNMIDQSGPTSYLATIEVVDLLRLFRLRWAPVEQGVVLVTSFLLGEENGGTRATITETGYDALPKDQRQQWLDSTDAGYTMSMENLKAYLEGRLIPH
jgi:hypothetical protein